MGLLVPIVACCAVLLFAFAIFSSSFGRAPVAVQDQPLDARKHGNHAVPEPPPQAAAITAASSEEQQRIAFPLYTHCFQSPEFTAQARSGTCAMLHKPTTNYYKIATDEFRTVAKIQIDPSRCRSFLDKFGGDPGTLEERKALLDKFEIDLRPGSTDHDVFLQVYCGGPRGDFGFMPHLSAYMPVNRPVSILDAGANIGGASILFAQLVAFNGEVLAVDANPMTFELLTSNLRPFLGVVTPVKTAIVAHATALAGETIAFSGDSDQYWGFRVEHTAVPRPQRVVHQVETKSLPMLRDMSRAKTFDFIKLDIEGEEKHILTDPPSAEVLCAARCIFMELHERFEPGCRAAFEAFQASGCAEADKFGHVVSTGEYMLFCKHSLIAAHRAGDARR